MKVNLYNFTKWICNTPTGGRWGVKEDHILTQCVTGVQYPRINVYDLWNSQVNTSVS